PALPSPGLIYCATRDHTQIVADFLQEQGLDVPAYHAGRTPERKKELQTSFLQGANQQLRSACESLFEDYVKIIGYHVSLEKCRQQDDWEQVRMDLGNYLSNLEGMETIPSDYRRALINLEFATQRVAEFINVYQSAIVQGTQYYQKFDRILNGYENEEHCDGQLPMQFEELKYDVKSTIEKFRNTYHLPEIQGSRMKQLLYGHLSP
ncbi:MAG: hypothetical protein AAFU60_15755, partial [Bacteroidota bacterium]